MRKNIKNKMICLSLLLTCMQTVSAYQSHIIENSDLLRDQYITTPLHEIVIKQYVDKNQKLYDIEELLKNGANVNAKNQDRRTPLWLVTFYGGDNSIINLLIKYGADVTLSDTFNVTPLHNIVTRDNLIAARILLNSGANMKPHTIEKMISFKNDEEKTPLDIIQTEEMGEALLINDIEIA